MNNKNNILTIENRACITMTGLIEVLEFTDTQVLLYTNMGDVRIKGLKLQVESADTVTGEFRLCGYIQAIIYSENKEKTPQNFITKLFK